MKAAPGEEALRWYKYFIEKARESVSTVAYGAFGQMMDVEMVNHGPVTIILDSEKTI